MPSRERLEAFDYGLFGLGVLGLVLFVWLLPSQHPDAAASYAFGREQAVEASRAFLNDEGYATEGMVAQARLSRLPSLLDSLQARLGRPEMLHMLRSGGDATLPAHYWSVRWHRPDLRPAVGRPEEAGGPTSNRLAYKVALTQQGAVWGFSNERAVIPRDGVDRDVLRAVLEADAKMDQMLTAPPDSALAALLYFDLSSASQLADSLALIQADQDRFYEAAETGQPQGLGEAAAALIARQHLSATALSALPLAVESVASLPERGRSAARVRFVTQEHVWGQHAVVNADVSAAGALLELDTAFNEETDSDAASGEEANFQLGVNSESDLRGLVKGIAYVLVVLLLLAVVLRRVGARALDTRAALKDALVAGVFAAAAVALAAPSFAVQAGYSWQLFTFIGVAMLFVGVGVGLVVLVASGAADALARGAWPEKIGTLTLARQGAWVNQPMGLVLLHAAAAAGLVLGLVTLALVLAPHSYLHEDILFGAESSFSIAAMALARCAWYALLLVFAVHTALGSMLQKRWPWVVMPGLALILMAVGFDAVTLPVGSAFVAWGIPLVVGFVLAFVFIRYDALTLLVTVVLTGVLWDTAEGWLVSESPAFIDAALGWAVYAGVVGLGIVGVKSSRTGEQLPSYIPDYVAEQRERGRLQRELEIAREVQRSFLPVRMPRVPGLDLAAACVAAEEVGGDYYDVIPLDGRRIALVIGDVSGKGIQAAFFMTLAKGFLQTLARETESPAEVLRRANRLFFANVPRGTFISLIYGVFDLDTQTFTFARAGHNPVILKRSPNQTADLIQPAGLAIGLTANEVFDRTIEEGTITLRHGDTLVFYTDGFSEAMDPAKHLYTDERLADTVAATSADVSASQLLQALIDDVVEHAGTARQHDDMTMVVVRIGALPDADVRLDRTSHPDTYIGYA